MSQSHAISRGAHQDIPCCIWLPTADHLLTARDSDQRLGYSASHVAKSSRMTVSTPQSLHVLAGLDRLSRAPPAAHHKWKLRGHSLVRKAGRGGSPAGGLPDGKLFRGVAEAPPFAKPDGI